MRAARAAVWFGGTAMGAALMLTLTVTAWGTAFPVWVGLVVVAATLLCGDVAERGWLRLARARGLQPDAA
jgi:hypothetical protein